MDEVVIQILFFAKARELVGKQLDSITLSVSCTRTTGKNVLDLIIQRFPLLEPISKNIVLAVNEEYIDPDQLLDIENCREIAVIPPLSGG